MWYSCFLVLCLFFAVGVTRATILNDSRLYNYLENLTDRQCNQDYVCILTPPTDTVETSNIESITVTLLDKCLENYCNNYAGFQHAVATMGAQFAEEKNIPLLQDITPQDVVVITVKHCADVSNCVQVEFGLPVKVSPDYGPQFSVHNLEMMWVAFADDFFPILTTPQEDPSSTLETTESIQSSTAATKPVCDEEYVCYLPPPPQLVIETVNGKLVPDACLKEYCADHRKFQSVIAVMASDFVNNKLNFELESAIKDSDVVVTAIKYCTSNSASANSCIQFTFGLTIDVPATHGHQLNETNLVWMWDALASQHFPNIFITEGPDSSSDVTSSNTGLLQWQQVLILMIFIILCFSVVLYFLRKLALKLYGLNGDKWKSRASEVKIIDEDELRRDSIGPHTLQTLPAFDLFESAYPYFEPIVSEGKQRPSMLEDNISIANNELMFASRERRPTDPVPDRPHTYLK